jgi:methyltransferase (TIGR00027 family)
VRMRPGRASKTAEHNALFRALEMRAPERERLVADPFAAAFLTWPLRLVDVAARSRVGRVGAVTFIDRRWPGVRTSVVARTRLIDEMIADAIGVVSMQMVVLGAGFDTRPWRLACLRDHPAIFEVDHPDTQRRKRAILARRELDGALVRFVPSDFRLDRLATAMIEQGFSRSIPTLFLWEGTTNYLDEDAVDATLRWCAAAPPGSRLIFTYINDDVLRDPTRYQGARGVFATLERVNERMTFGMAPERMASYLAVRGLHLDQDLGAGEYRAKYYGDRALAMRGHEFYRVATAHISPGARSSNATAAEP